MSDFAKRKLLLKDIAKTRKSSVISYVTGDRPGMETHVSTDIIDLFVEHLDEIGPTKKISLLLYTAGGDVAAAWRLINLLHTFCDELEVIVTAKALSAGTLISLGANVIIMTKQAALGPIDPSVNNPMNPIIPGSNNNKTPVSVEAVRGYFDEAGRMGIKDPAELARIFIDLSNKIHPLVLGQIFRTREQIRFLAKKLLGKHMDDAQKTNEIIDFLCAESGSHDYTINRREARELGLNIEKPSDSFYLKLKELHSSYVEELKLSEPYNPYAHFINEPQVDYSIPRAMIESVKTGSHQFISEGILTKTTTLVEHPGGHSQQDFLSDNRRFEGWKITR